MLEAWFYLLCVWTSPIGQLLDGGFLNFSMACSTEKLPSRWRDGTCWKLVVARTKSVIACFAAASFHDGSGEDCRAPAQTGTNNSGSMTKQMIIPARSFDTFISPVCCSLGRQSRNQGIVR